MLIFQYEFFVADGFVFEKCNCDSTLLEVDC